MEKIKILFIVILLSACGIPHNETAAFTTHDLNNPIVKTANRYLGMEERKNRSTLKQFMGLDPVSYEWCAAFLNAVLNELGIPGSETVSDYPLTARSFTSWGEEVVDGPLPGDIVVFPRGTQGWQGHVGILAGTFTENGVEYFIILGGNQDNKVSYKTYSAKSAIAIRRQP